MLNESMQKALNKQINYEFYSSQLYLSMSAYFNSVDLDGFAHWMRIQYREEVYHAMKLLDFIHTRDGRVKLDTIEEPKFEWESPLHAFQDTYEHERSITVRINELVAKSIRDNDHATQNFLQWYIAEQVEEEASAKSVMGKLKLAGNSNSAVLLLDQEMGKRLLSIPNEDFGAIQQP